MLKRVAQALLAAFSLALAAPVLAQRPNLPLGAGERYIPVTTPQGRYKVWVKKVGDSPKLKVLLLHGGPGATHEGFENFAQFLPQQGIEYYYYDQLGSGRSDHPDDDRLWTTERFADEVEQVRTALGLDKGNFCLYGQSWGGILAIEYALKYQANLKCLIISNMMASIPAYNDYARTVLMPAMDQKKLAEVQALEAAGKTDDPRYMQILVPMHYEQHVLRRPAADWPEPINRMFSHLNSHVYTLMQGPSELGASGRLVNWDRFDDLARITVPTLVIGARHDTMDPVHMARMAVRLPHGDLLYMPESGHAAWWDEPDRCFAGMTGFLKKLP